jgi:lysyl-tRNA synthetase class 2
MEYSEKLIQHIFSSLNISPLVPIKNKEGKETIIDFGKPFERIDYIQRILQDTGIDILKYTEDEKGLLLEIEKQGVVIEDAKNMGYASLVDNLYKQTTRKKITGPAFLYNYPLKMQPLARVSDTNPNIVDQFQLVVNGWEIMKAYSELVDPVDQAKRFWQQEQEALKGDAEAMQGDNEYITCMEYGMPPISGAGFGIDRFITLITQQDNLRDCVFFPLMRPKP